MNERRSIVGTAAAVLFALWLGACGKESVPEETQSVRPVKTVVVGGAAEEIQVLAARIEAAQRATLSFRVGGPLVELPIEKGQAVKQGDLVARIDPRDFEIAVAEARANFTKAEADFERYKNLYERNAVSVAELDVRRSQHDVAKAKLEEAEANLSDTRLLAPFPGNITERFVENFQTVQPKQEIAALQNLDALDVVVDVPEQMIATVRGRRGSVTAHARFAVAAGRQFPLTFREVAAQADPKTQTYEVRFAMQSPDDLNILTGMNAEVVIQTQAGEAADASITLPASAVFVSDEDGSSSVWVISAELTASRRVVELGGVTGTGDVQILSGLAIGERVAVAAVRQLREGMKVRLLEGGE